MKVKTCCLLALLLIKSAAAGFRQYSLEQNEGGMIIFINYDYIHINRSSVLTMNQMGIKNAEEKLTDIIFLSHLAVINGREVGILDFDAVIIVI